jgi:hypothetical protein
MRVLRVLRVYKKQTLYARVCVRAWKTELLPRRVKDFGALHSDEIVKFQRAPWSPFPDREVKPVPPVGGNAPGRRGVFLKISAPWLVGAAHVSWMGPERGNAVAFNVR